MGNDGGDIPGRKELVKEKPKVEIPSAEAIAISKSRFCNLTNQRFREPLAICKLGYLYNYENILKELIQKTLPSKYSYIRKLTDIKQVKIDRAPHYSVNFISCPITKLQYNGFNKFVALWKCGHVISRKAFKQVKSTTKACIICETAYEETDVIDLNLEGDELTHMRMRLLKKHEKKEKPKEEDDLKDQPIKKIKQKSYVNSIDKLGQEFRDVLRERPNFKGMFHKK